MDPKEFSLLKPKVVLGVAAHPDDLDFGCSGTIARWSSEGAKTYYLIITDGSKGSSDPKLTSEELIKIRQEEQRAAGKVLGLQDVFFLNYPDSYLEVTQDLKKDIVKMIRKIKPDVVITMDPTVVYSLSRGFINHSDHRAAGQSTIDAVFPQARDRLTFPELLEEGLEPHKVPTLLLTNFDKQNFYVDISDYVDIKLDALMKHESQVSNPDETKKFVKGFTKKAGEKSGYDYAEGFIRLDMPL
jgi:LmbE family N-acetylglucosaminyl deacetylase